MVKQQFVEPRCHLQTMETNCLNRHTDEIMNRCGSSIELFGVAFPHRLISAICKNNGSRVLGKKWKFNIKLYLYPQCKSYRVSRSEKVQLYKFVGIYENIYYSTDFLSCSCVEFLRNGGWECKSLDYDKTAKNCTEEAAQAAYAQAVLMKEKFLENETALLCRWTKNFKYTHKYFVYKCFAS